MSQPNNEPNLSELERDLDAVVKTALPTRPVAASPRPVVPEAGAGAGAWGPATLTARSVFEPHAGEQARVTAPTPTMTAQLGCIHDDAQRLIESLQGMQQALTLIKRKLG